MRELLRRYRQSPAELRQQIQDHRDRVPAPLAASFEHRQKAEAVALHIQRFNQQWICDYQAMRLFSGHTFDSEYGTIEQIRLVSGNTLYVYRTIYHVGTKVCVCLPVTAAEYISTTYNESTNLFTCSCIHISLHTLSLDVWIAESFIGSICRGECLSYF